MGKLTSIDNGQADYTGLSDGSVLSALVGGPMEMLVVADAASINTVL
ncbi:MAG: hypothetical protein V7629_01785 [Motiliproteus sp.]